MEGTVAEKMVIEGTLVERSVNEKMVVEETVSKTLFKGCVHCIFASLLLGLNESTCQMKKNVYFTSKPLFVLEKIKF